MAIPNLFIIGAPKCGTSALAHYLSEHPAVYFCDPKEPFFLSDDYPRLKEQHSLNSLEDYLSLFKDADPEIHAVIGEGSTNYLASKVAVDKAVRLNPHGKFIVMLRDPVEVAYAYHMEQLWARNEDVEDFEVAWRLQDDRARGKFVPDTCVAEQFLQYRELALFSPQIERLFSLVPEEQRLVLLIDDLKREPEQVYRTALRFLELNDDNKTTFPVINPSHKHRSELIANLVLKPPRPIRGVIFRFRAWARRSRPWWIEAIKSALRVRQKRMPLRPEFERELRECFIDDIEELERLIGRDLSSWRHKTDSKIP